MGKSVLEMIRERERSTQSKSVLDTIMETERRMEEEAKYKDNVTPNLIYGYPSVPEDKKPSAVAYTGDYYDRPAFSSEPPKTDKARLNLVDTIKYIFRPRQIQKPELQKMPPLASIDPTRAINPPGEPRPKGLPSYIARKLAQGVKSVFSGISYKTAADQVEFIDRQLKSKLFPPSQEQRKKLEATRDFYMGVIKSEMEQDKASQKALEEEYAHLPKWQQVTGELIGTVGQVAPIAAAGALAGPAGAIGVSSGVLYGMASGHATAEALEEGADLASALKAGRLSGAKEVAIERLFGGIPGMGKGIISLIKSKAGRAAVNRLAKAGRLSGAKKVIISLSTKKLVEKFIKSKAGRAAVNRLFNAIGEGAEEVLAEFIEPYIKRYIYNPDAPAPSPEEYFMAFGGGTIASLILGIPYDIIESSRAAEQAKGGKQVGEAAIPFNSELSALALRRRGYKEVKKGLGVWVLKDTTTGEQIDLQREMVNINGIGVYKSDIYLTERKLGRKLRPKELALGAKDPLYFATLRGLTQQRTTTETQRARTPEQLFLLGAGEKLAQEAVSQTVTTEGKPSVTEVPEVKQTIQETKEPIESVKTAERTPIRITTIEKDPAKISDKPVSDEYYIHMSGENGLNSYYVKVDKAKKVDILPWLDTFAQKIGQREWSISDGKTGALITTGRTLNKAIEAAKERLKDEKRAQELIARYIKKYGVTPRYRLQGPIEKKPVSQEMPKAEFNRGDVVNDGIHNYVIDKIEGNEITIVGADAQYMERKVVSPDDIKAGKIEVKQPGTEIMEGGLENVKGETEPVRTDGDRPLEGTQTEDVRRAEEEGQVNTGGPGGPGEDKGRISGPDRKWAGVRPGMGDGEGEVYPPTKRRGQAEPVEEEKETKEEKKPEKKPTKEKEPSEGPEEKPEPENIKDIVKSKIEKITTSPRGQNAVIEGELELGGDKTRARNNIAAIRLVKQLEAENRPATPEEQDILLKYVGWGGLANVTYTNAWGQPHTEWAKEHDELKALVTHEEWQSIRESTLNAHYTSISVIKAMYKGLEKLGFKGGRILEPAVGVGHFIGAAPAKYGDKVIFTGVEIDKITGAIAKHLYPQSNIHIKGFEEVNLPDNYFDVAISNVPFGNYGVVDKRYPSHVTSAIHNYFFAKALDKVRPGGIVMFITSRYTMDAKTGTRMRNYIMEKADLLGAIRLPNTAFKSNARTEVVTDIVILKKRKPGTKYAGEKFLNTGEIALMNRYGYKQNVEINQYFIEHPDMILGNMSLEGTMYRSGDFTVDPGDKPLPSALSVAFSKIKGQMDYPDLTVELQQAAASVLPAPGDVKPGGFVFKEGKLYRRDGEHLRPYEAGSKKALERIKGMLKIRDQVRKILIMQRDGIPEKELAKDRKKLNELYDDFVKKYDNLHSLGNSLAFSDDPDYYLLLSLEEYDSFTKTAKKSAIFFTNTTSPIKRINRVDTPKEALIVSLNEIGKVNIERMRQLTGMTEQEIVEGLKGLIYKTPEGYYETAEQYLSGNVRQKLKDAEAMAAINPSFNENVEALKKVIPEEITSAEITLSLGAPWVPTEIYEEFIGHLYGRPARDVTVKYIPEAGKWTILASHSIEASGDNIFKWGTKRMPGTKIIDFIFNSKDVIVKDRDPDDNKYYVNKQETLAAKEKEEKIKAEFEKWIWSDKEREKSLVELYNDLFNNIHLVTYDGSHLELPGSNPAKPLRPHQKNAVWRIIASGGNTLLAHNVGTGKTGIMSAAAMELRRMGLVKKPMFVVPNHLVGQTGEEFLSFYPGASILVATKKDFETKNRKEFLNKIATGEYDAIIVGHSQFGMIPMSPDFISEFYQEQIDTLESYLKLERISKKGKNPSEKQLAAAIKRLKNRMNKAVSKVMKDISVVHFEELGVDSLFVDEAHEFKNLMYYSSMNNVSGLGDKEGSGMAFDLYMKVKYLQALNGGRGIVFSTATPVSNSMAEMYTMQRYLQPDLLKQRGLDNFDAWAKTFGQVRTILEMTPEGKGYRQKPSFSTFINLGELLQMYRSFADVLKEIPGLKLPKVKGGKMTTVTVQPSKALINYVDELVERADAVRQRLVDSSVDNMLKINTDGRKAALDMRLIDPSLPDDPNSKINVAIGNIFDQWNDPEKKRKRLTQIVFLDLSTFKPPKIVDGQEVEVEEEVTAEEVNLYREMKQKLIAKGVPENEIAFIHEAKTNATKLKLYDDMNHGRIRILIGSTKKMGTGMNAQRLVADLHHLDAPYRPSDIEQRNGRAVRQGNLNEEVTIWVYNTERSLDARMWDILQRKQKFIDQIMTSSVNVRKAEDIGEVVLNFQEIAAIASGNPLIQEQVVNAAEVNKYLALKQNWAEEQRRIRNQIQWAITNQATYAKEIEKYKEDLKTAQDTSGDNFKVTIEGKAYTDRKEAGSAVMKLYLQFLKNTAKSAKLETADYLKIGRFAGFDLYITNSRHLVAQGKMTYYTEIRAEGSIMFRELTNQINHINNYIKDRERWIVENKDKQKDMEARAGHPFEHEEALKKALKRKEEIEAELGFVEGGEIVIADEPEDDTEAMPAFVSRSQRISSAKTSIEHNVEVQAKIQGGRGAKIKKIVYHGSPNEFARFDIERSHGMIWFTGNKEYAAQFGKVKKYEITLNNPLDMREYTEEMDLNQWQEILVNHGIDTSNIDWETVDFAPEYGLYWCYDLLPHAGNNYADGGVLEAIKSAGYDGIIAPPEYEGEIGSGETYVVFSVEQISDTTEGLTSPIGHHGLGPATGKNVSGKAKRASEIVKDFENRLEMAIKKGGLHWSRIGQFNNRTYITRIAKANDIPTLSHEAGHYFDKLYTLTDLQMLKNRLGKAYKTVEDQLLNLGAATSRKSYTKTKIRREGIAEFTREYLTNRDNAIKSYPELAKYFQEFIPNNVLAVIEDLASDIDALVNLDPVSRGMRHIHFKGDPKYPVPFDLPRKLRQLWTGIVDASYPVIWAATELGGKVFANKIANELSVLRGWEGIALADINPTGEEGYYQSDLEGKRVGPSYFEIVKDIHKDEQTRREFWVYSVARRSRDYFDAGLDLPDSKDVYEAQIRILEPRHPEFKQTHEALVDFRDNNLDLLVQAGVYSAKDKARIRLANPNYVSMKRIKEAFDYVAGTSQKLGAAKRVVKRRTGGGEDIMDPEENDITNTFIYRSVAMRNHLLTRVADIADSVEGKGWIMAKAPVKTKVLMFNLEKVKKYLYEIFDGMEGIEEYYGGAKSFVDSLDLDILARVFNPQYLAGPNQVVVYRNGEPEIYDVHPDLYEAVNGLSPENMTLLTETLMAIAQVTKSGIIYTPQFIARNAARDTFHNLISSETNLNPVDIFSGFYSALRKDKWYRLAQRKGGTTNFFTANDRKFAQEAIDQIMANGNRANEMALKLNEALGLMKKGYVGQGLWAGFKSFGVPLKLMQDWIEPGEMGGRIAETKKTIISYLKAAGYTQADIKKLTDEQIFDIVPDQVLKLGIARGRNLSVDFRKMGKWIKKSQMNRLVNFLNPSIQGTANVGLLMKNHPIRTTVKGILYLTIPTLLNLWLNWENENYHRLAWYWRDFFWMVPLGDPKTTRIFLPIPRPWELGVMFAALPERLITQYLKNNPRGWKEFDETIRRTLLPEIIPSGVEPLYRDAVGEDWRGVPILSESDKRVSPHLQFNEYTSIVARKIAEALKDVPGVPEFMKSPKRFQKVIEGYTGTLGRVFLESIDITLGEKEGIPIIGGLTQGFKVDAYKSNQPINDYYDNKAVLDRMYADANRTGEELPQHIKDLRAAFYQADNAMELLNTAITLLEKSDRPNKTLEATAIRADIIELVEAINEEYNRVMHGQK